MNDSPIKILQVCPNQKAAIFAWKLQDISSLISPEIIRQISLIPIGDGLENERLIWPWNKSGFYTVKSGYHWHYAITIRSIPDNSHTSHRVNPMIWKIIWRLKTTKDQIFSLESSHKCDPYSL